MYIGICSEHGNKVDDEDAFWYAMNRLLETPEEREAFEKEFSESLIEWFYSGNWVHKEDKEDE